MHVVSTNGSDRKKTSGFRQHNEQRVVDVLRLSGPSSQAGLARATGLSPATITSIVRSLTSDGRVGSRSVNGRETLVSLTAGSGRLVSISVRPESVSGALFDLEREFRVDASSTDVGVEMPSSPEVVAQVVEELARRADLSTYDLTEVATAVQGPISRETGAVASWAGTHMPSWRNIVIRAELEQRLDLPVFVDNDANLAAIAEWTWGAGRGASNLFYLMCSDHVGGAFLHNGEVFSGADGLAGEIGHMVVDHTGPVCECGSRGCLTMYASQHALLTGLRRHAAFVSTREVIDAAESGDLAARGALFEVGRLLGRAFANVGKLTAPNVMVLGGDLGRAGRLVLESLDASLEITSLRAVSPSIQLRPAGITDGAVILGGVAALLRRSGGDLSELPLWMEFGSTTNSSDE